MLKGNTKKASAIRIGCLLLLLLTKSSTLATSYYVHQNHPSASDSNPGTLHSPWASIQQATETATAGDTVYIRNGNYHESVYFTNDGNASRGHIVFTAYANETPIIDGTSVTDANNGIILNKNYIKLLSLEICNWNENGIWIENAAEIEISDCVVHSVEYGIGVAEGTHDFTFNRVTVHHFSLYGFDVSPVGGVDCYNGTFNDCVAHSGRDRDQNVDGFALGHGTQHDFVFNRCVTYAVYDGFDISSGNSRLNRCLAYDCWNSCYKLWQDAIELVNCIGYQAETAIVELDWDEHPGATTLRNCTFFNGQTYTLWIENSADTLRLYNCILAGSDNIGLAFEQMGHPNYFGDFNLFQHDSPERLISVGYTDEFTPDAVSNGTWTAYSGQDVHSLVVQTATALFVNPVAPDLHLTAGSPAIDQANRLWAPFEDYDGLPRPSGNGFDIGACEYQFSSAVMSNTTAATVPTTPILYQNFPNPFNAVTSIIFQGSEPRQPIKLCIFNLQGQLIRTLVNQTPLTSPGQVQWDTRNESGEFVASGTYLCVLSNGVTKITRKLVLEK